ncbi:hypothetical protein [Alicyclobacillus macrosporangiidus]|uniref:hypothetical protein n=1 Tax=Alicyclobacillus macrosporangiidus TaxID=392015 RepID=UPI000943D8B8|nr:hypothetical protein [Alicyclobacillus macrosporangiidus]
MPNVHDAVRINPFASGRLDDIITQVQALLHEKTGAQDEFLTMEQDNLVRTVLEVQVPLWPETGLAQFANLVAEPREFRGICVSVVNCIHPEFNVDNSLRFENNSNESKRLYIAAALAQMNPDLRRRVVSAAKTFLEHTRTEQQLGLAKIIGKGISLTLS